MRPQRTEGCGGLNEVLNQPVAILYLVSFLASQNDNMPIKCTFETFILLNLCLLCIFK